MQLDNKQEKIRVLVVEGSDLIRIGISFLVMQQPHLHLAGETNKNTDAAMLVTEHKPHIVLFDAHLADAGSLEKIFGQIRSLSSHARILALADTDDKNTLMAIIQAGALGIFGKRQPSSILLKAIDAVIAGECWFERNITKLILQVANCHHPSGRDIREEVSSEIAACHQADASKPQNGIDTLTTKESCIACLISLGFSAKKTADKMCLSEKTVRNYLTNIYEKSSSKSQVEFCLKFSLLDFCGASQPYTQDKCPYRSG